MAAVSEVNSDRLGLRESARLYNVPLETLRRRAKGMVTMDCRPGPKTVLTDEEESEIRISIEIREIVKSQKSM